MEGNHTTGNPMIKLTILHHKLTTEALRIFHNVTEINESKLYEWEQDLDSSRAIGEEYPKKPFIEPFEFDDDHYEITELPFRVRKSDIHDYRTNLDGQTQISTTKDETLIIKESIEFLDEIFVLE